MAKQVINTGTAANDGTGDPIRTAFGKVNDNFTEVYSSVESLGSISSYDVWVGTQAAYDALGEWDDNTLYYIIEENV